MSHVLSFFVTMETIRLSCDLETYDLEYNVCISSRSITVIHMTVRTVKRKED